jgi:acetyl-CoA synthetase
MTEGRDAWWHDEMAKVKATSARGRAVDSEHPLFILYTSGSTGQAQGHHAHDRRATSSARTMTTKYVFDLRDDDVYWCTADVGWVTGHSYIVYGPLANGATVVMYEGAPNRPTSDRFWEMVERHRVTSSTRRRRRSARS